MTAFYGNLPAVCVDVRIARRVTARAEEIAPGIVP
jgi:hypothetical protein